MVYDTVGIVIADCIEIFDNVSHLGLLDIMQCQSKRGGLH